MIYASALQGWASTDYTERRPDMSALFEADPDARAAAGGRRPDLPLQLQISTLDYNSYVGRIGIGRIRRGVVRPGETVALRYGDEDRGTAKIAQVLTFTGLQRSPVEEASAGDIVAITGIEDGQHRAHRLRSGARRGPAADQRRRADARDELPGEHLAARAAARASSSPAARSASACTASCRATWRCAWRTPRSRTSCASPGAASCT